MSGKDFNKFIGCDDSSESSIEVNLEYVITEKPDSDTVREFMRANLATIRSAEDMMFAFTPAPSK